MVVSKKQLDAKQAWVLTTETGKQYLQSYQSIVAVKFDDGTFMLYKDWCYSRTTQNHVRQFTGLTGSELRAMRAYDFWNDYIARGELDK